MKTMKLVGLAIACGLTFSLPAQASVLATYDFTSDTNGAIHDARVASTAFSSSSSAYIGIDGFGSILEVYPNIDGGSEADAVAANSYFQIDLAAAPSDTLGLESLSFDAGKGGYSSPRSFFVRSSLDGFSTDLISQSFGDGQSAPSLYGVNLASAFGSATNVTFRFYVTTPSAANNSMDFRALSFDSAPFSPGVPEPATWALMIMGFGLAGSALRRKSAAAAA